MGKPLTLLFDPFESIVLFLAGECTKKRYVIWFSLIEVLKIVLTVAFCINDGRSNWLEGLILMSEYHPVFILGYTDF